MHPPRFPNFILWTRVRRAHAAAVLTLALALVAGLACDENIPTETRAPSSPSEMSASSGEVDGLAQRDPSALAIPLPVNQSVSTAFPNPAFRINQTGTGQNGIFHITNTGSFQSALQGLNNGKGRAGFFQLTNAGNTQPALEVSTNARGPAGFFQGTNTTHVGPAFLVTNRGTGPAAVFEAFNTSSGQFAMHVINRGVSQTGFFQATNPNNTSGVLLASTVGSGIVFQAISNGSGLAGVFGINQHTNRNPALQAITFGTGPAGRFLSPNATSSGNALHASSRGRGTTLLVEAEGLGSHGIDVAQTASTGTGVFVFNSHASNPRPALQVTTNGTGPAIEVIRGPSIFNDVQVRGRLTKNAGSFRIDHPLHPEHKYLSHSFVESPDMMNVYNGNVTLDENGRATVELPDYFEALNKDFRYQLTAVGAPGPNLYIAEGVKGNRFKIAGGRPYASVSWMVTGVRQDPYANENRIKVEEDKPVEEEKPGGARLVAGR